MKATSTRTKKTAAIGGKGGDILVYTTKDGRAAVDVRLVQESLWLDAHQMSRLFDRDRSVILRHIRNTYKTNELEPISTCAKFAQVAADGKVRTMDLYNLDVIIFVGYRVNSRRGTEFRIWATSVLRDHIIGRSFPATRGFKNFISHRAHRGSRRISKQGQNFEPLENIWNFAVGPWGDKVGTAI